MATLLPKKNRQQIPVATDDDHYDQMAEDPSIPEIPRGTNYADYTIVTSKAPQTQSNFGLQETYQEPVLTQAAETTAANNAEVLVKNTNEGWMNKKWRPAMGWTYMAVCVCDFILFPIMFTIVQFWETQAANDAFRQWQPITLQGGGLFHLAMGAVIGVTSYGRTKEKIEGKA